ncbi:MAG: gliding motility-associated C-terminal domain-containing protein [Chitinophagaceae bacterium]
MNKSCFGKLPALLPVLLLMLVAQVAIGQGFFNTTNWRFSNPKPFGFTPLDVDYFDDNIAIAVGSEGGIAKSNDGGRNWTYGVFTYMAPSGFVTRSTFNDVHYSSANVAYAVGNSGSMAKTTDGGATWTLVNNPLFANQRNINACFFLDDNRGYIGGQFNTLDSLPKLYVTNNGGATWDSISAPVPNGVTRCGYINNPNVPSVLLPVNAKAKEIHRIEFLPNGVGYISGSGSPLFPVVSVNAVAATCLPSTGTLTTGAHNASLLWKLEQGVLTDYSISKERIGYTGINTNTVTCTTGFGNLAPTVQTYKALKVINDSTVVIMAFNNNTVVRVRTGPNDRTANVNNGGALENGKYEVLNFPFPPTGGPNAGPPIPNPQVLLASNPYHIKRSSNGTLVAGSFNSAFAGTPGYLWTSTDTGRNWVRRNLGPQGQNWSNAFGAPAIDIAPNGRILALGQNGVVGDSISGSGWQSTYISVPLSAGYSDMEFADCNNGIAAGGSGITVTIDGGKNWIDKANGALAALFANITSVTYPQVNKIFFTTSIGTIYRSVNQGTSLTPAFIDNYGGTSVINDLASIGADSLWACGAQQTSVTAAQRFGLVYRSFNNGTTWDTVKVGPIGITGTQAQQFVTFRGIEFPSRNIGYISGNRGAVYKTINGGATWTNISPFPAINISPVGFANSAVTYTDIFALDNNTVFVVGNMFTTANNRRIYKTTDGGANWTDISSNIDLLSGGNLNGILMHDINNGYVAVPGGVLYKTNNGGVSWVMDLAPTANLFTALAFAPKTVPASVSMINRRLFVSGPNISGAPMMEYGNPVNINVNSTETITSSCDNTGNGSITINATGGIGPYTYSINGGAFQSSNIFTGVAIGPKTITIKDAFCGTLTKTVTVPTRVSPTVDAGPDKIIVEGDDVMLQGSSTGIPVTISWSPSSSIVSGGNTFNPLVKPPVTTNYILTVTEQNGCSSTDVAAVTVIPYCIKVMNAFTPNGDGMNDRWLVTTGATCTKRIAVAVFNRYGNVVYKNDNYNNDWNGTYNNKPVPDGTYYYTVTYITITDRTVFMKGDVTILR